MQRLILFLLILFCAGFQGAASAASLVMMEQEYCEYCEAWDADVGVIYGKTPEGEKAPLRRIDIHDTLPDDLKFITGVVFTPTFVLVEDGKEIGRIRGYPGEDFFWGLLQKMLEKLPAEKKLSALHIKNTQTARDLKIDRVVKKEEQVHD